MRFLLDQLDERFVAGDADVQVAVGAEDDAVRAALDEIGRGLLVGQLDARAAVGRAAGRERIDGALILVLLDGRASSGSFSPASPA